MELPIELRTEIENRCAACRQQDLAAAAAALSERYRKESGTGKRLLTKQVEALAYAVVRMSATYAAVHTALARTLACFSGEITSILDLGAGTGAAVWAAADLIPGTPEITCLEREKAMEDLGRSLMAGHPLLGRTKWISRDLSAGNLREGADLVIASYALNEFSPEKREEVLRSAWEKTGKLLLIIEPGTPVGSGQLRRAKEILTRLGGQVIAPCPGNGKCPLPAEDWCHFTARVSRSRLHKQLKGGDAPYEDEKFSFLAVAKEPGSPAQARVLRHPMKNPGYIGLRLCTEEGVVDTTVTKKQGQLFKTARKADAGDAFPKLP